MVEYTRKHTVSNIALEIRFQSKVREKKDRPVFITSRLKNIKLLLFDQIVRKGPSEFDTD